MLDITDLNNMFGLYRNLCWCSIIKTIRYIDGNLPKGPYRACVSRVGVWGGVWVWGGCGCGVEGLLLYKQQLNWEAFRDISNFHTGHVTVFLCFSCLTTRWRRCSSWGGTVGNNNVRAIDYSSYKFAQIRQTLSFPSRHFCLLNFPTKVTHEFTKMTTEILLSWFLRYLTEGKSCHILLETCDDVWRISNVRKNDKKLKRYWIN